MDRCLQSPEILRLICDEIPTSRHFERQWVLAVALSCRAFLEPALDRLWHRVHSFEIFRSTVPSDVWKSQDIRVKHKDQPAGFEETLKYAYKLLDLHRAITIEDLDRYINYYAPRIREVHIREVVVTLSSAAWHGLHLAVNWRSGALAPNAVEIKWPLAPPEETLIPPDVLNQAWPYYVLFMNSNTTSLDFAFRSDCPVQVASLRYAAQHPNLKRLHIEDQTSGLLEDEEEDDKGALFIDKFIQAFPWSHLQALDVADLTGDSVAHLSALPSLRHLKIEFLGDVDLHHEYAPLDYTRRPGYISDLSPEAFASLEVLDLSADKLISLAGFLQGIPATNLIHTLKCKMEDATDHQDDLRTLLATIKYHCNPERLRHLEMRDEACKTQWEEEGDIGVTTVVDIAPFFEFGNLERVIFSLSENVAITSENISGIVSSWPKLVELNIDVGFPTSRLPLLDHEDCLTLLYGCPNLERMGLYFDATRITGTEPVPLPLAGPSQEMKPASLSYLHVGISPIFSPSKVVNFFRIHCPSLFRGRNRLSRTSPGETHAEVFNYVYSNRWCDAAIQIDRGLS